MYLSILSFVAGTISLQFFSKLPSNIIAVIILSLVLLFALIIHRTYPKKKKLCGCFLLTFFALLGFNWSSFYAHQILKWSLNKNLEKQNVIIEGYITSLPKYDEEKMSFIFKMTHLNGKEEKAKLLINWYKDYPKYPFLKVNDKWRLAVRLKRPHSNLNPGSFDVEKYFLVNSIRATGYVINNPLNARLNSNKFYFNINKLREYLNVKIKDSLRGLPFTNFISALVIGDQSGIDKTEWQVLRRTGTIHFLIIAGLHIGFIAGLMFFLAKSMLKFFPRLTLYIPAPYFGACGALLGAITYSALAGFSIPTERATIMIGIFMLSLLLQRNIPAGHSLLIALLIIILLNPLAGLSSGFWLSFAAVFIITYSLESRIVKPGKYGRYFKLQLSLTLGLIPLTLLFFCEAPIVSFLANIITIPAMGFIIIPLSFTGSLFLLFAPSIGHGLLLISTKILSIIWQWLSYLSTLPLASFHHNIFNNWILFSSLISMLLFLSPRYLPCRSIFIVWLIPLIFYLPPGPTASSEIWFTLLDVGQGLASVIRTKNHVMVYDTGLKLKDGSDSGETIIEPFLRNIGVKKIDMLIISHNDEDHSGGAQYLLNSMHIKYVMASKPEVFKDHNARKCQSGMTWSWDGVNFSFLHPPKDFPLEGNNASCVLKVTSGKNSVLFSGDIEKEAEKLLVAEKAQDLNSSILIVPHHGSRTSSKQYFVDAVNPKYALFSTGYLNRFRFPSKTVMKRYLKNKTLILNTAQTGAITFKFTSKSSMLAPELYRVTHKRYWHDNNDENTQNT